MPRICISAEYSFDDGTIATWERTDQFDEFKRRLYRVILSRRGDNPFHTTSYTRDPPTVAQSLHRLKNFFKDHPELKQS